MSEATASIRHVIAYFAQSHGEEDTIVKKANYALYILEYISNYLGIVKAAISLEKKDPNLAKIFKAFPGAEIVDIRDKQERGELNGEKSKEQT